MRSCSQSCPRLIQSSAFSRAHDRTTLTRTSPTTPKSAFTFCCGQTGQNGVIKRKRETKRGQSSLLTQVRERNQLALLGTELNARVRTCCVGKPGARRSLMLLLLRGFAQCRNRVMSEQNGTHGTGSVLTFDTTSKEKSVRVAQNGMECASWRNGNGSVPHNDNKTISAMNHNLNIWAVRRLAAGISAIASLTFFAKANAAESAVVDPPSESLPSNSPKPPELTPRQKLMSQFDLNKNGKLEPAEREAYLKYLEDERKKFIQQFDVNRDGVLDEEERNAARAFYFQKKLEQKAAAQAATQAAAQAGVQTPKASPAPAVPSK